MVGCSKAAEVELNMQTLAGVGAVRHCLCLVFLLASYCISLTLHCLVTAYRCPTSSGVRQRCRACSRPSCRLHEPPRRSGGTDGEARCVGTSICNYVAKVEDGCPSAKECLADKKVVDETIDCWRQNLSRSIHSSKERSRLLTVSTGTLCVGGSFASHLLLFEVAASQRFEAAVEELSSQSLKSSARVSCKTKELQHSIVERKSVLRTCRLGAAALHGLPYPQ